MFETIELKVVDKPTVCCPYCKGIATKLVSAPAIIYEIFDERAVHKLPDYHERMEAAKRHDARKRKELAPLLHDRGQDMKVYEAPFGKKEREQLRQQAQMDNV